MYKVKVQDIIMYVFLFGLLKMLVVIISLELLLWVLEAGGGEPGDAWLLATLVYFAEIPVCKFLRGWRAYRPKPFFL